MPPIATIQAINMQPVSSQITTGLVRADITSCIEVTKLALHTHCTKPELPFLVSRTVNYRTSMRVKIAKRLGRIIEEEGARAVTVALSLGLDTDSLLDAALFTCLVTFTAITLY